MTSDAAVIWSVLWFGRMRVNQQIYEHYRKDNRPVIVIDIGALRRGLTWKVAVNHVTAQGHYGHQHNLDLDRPQKLGIQLQTTNNARSEILICSQHSASLQMQDWSSSEQWINSRVDYLKTVTDRKLIVRPHPRSPINPALLTSKLQIQMPKKLDNTYDSFDFDMNYHAVVNHNSGPGIQAAMAGTRPLVDQSSLAAPVAVTDIEQPYDIDREQWLIEIAHTEYTVEELAAGAWYPRIEKILHD